MPENLSDSPDLSNLSPREQQAYDFAENAHGNQTYGERPYIEHPHEAATLAKELGYPEDIVIACLLHDVVEDTKVTIEEIREQFGDFVADAVEAATFTEDDDAREEAGTGPDKITKARGHPGGHVVKFCDSRVNYKNTEMEFREAILNHTVDVADIEDEVMDKYLRRRPRYRGNLALLKPGLPQPDDYRFGNLAT